MAELNKKEKESAKEIIEKLSRTSNNMAFDQKLFAKELADNLKREHRTLQQGLIKVLAEVFGELASSNFDMRNEAAVEWCKKFNELDRNFPFI